MSTDRGLCRFHPGANVFIQYDDPDALSNLEFNRMAFLSASDGRLYFGGLNGVTAFYPRDIDTSLNDLRPLLVSYAVIRRDRDTLIPASGIAQADQPLVFGHADKFFRFRFMLPAYRQPEKNKFIYRLEGWEDDWQTTVGTNTISYSYLPPGRYLLRVRGAPAGELWTRSAYTLPIVIRQAWYRTGWFVASLVLVMAGIFFAAYRYRLGQLMRIQNVRNKISADLHDELGSVLTQIALQSDMVSRDIYTSEEKRTELENIRNTSRTAIHAMSDIVWSVSAGHDKTSSLVDRMKDHADLMLQPLGLEPVFHVYGLQEERHIDGLVRQELFLIFKEAIHNIIKHSTPSYVRIDMGNAGGQFTLRVENDLPSPPKMQRPQGGHGLDNMRRRAARIQATLEATLAADAFVVSLRRREI
jgi:signal transduction histidine kinase